MHIPLHVLEQKLDSARKELPELLDKLRLTAGHYRRAMDKSSDKTIQPYRMDWREKPNSGWFGRIRVSEHHTRLFGIKWWVDSRFGVEALQVTESGLAMYYGPHFWKQYGERHKVAREHTYILREYFRDNFHMTYFSPGGYEKGYPKMDGITEHGLALGSLQSVNIISCNTFVDKDDLREDKKPIYHRLLVRHRMRDMRTEDLEQMGRSFQEGLVAVREVLRAA